MVVSGPGPDIPGGSRVADVVTSASRTEAISGIGSRTPGSRVRRALVLVNARKRSNPAFRSSLGLLTEAGVAVRIIDDVLTPESRARALEEARQSDVIVVCGGDGTLHCAAPLLLEAALPIAILPLGTANDLARTLHLPVDPVAAARLILDGRPHTIDLGEVNGIPYFNVATLGMSVELARHLTEDRKRRWGRLAYALTAARLVAGTKPFSSHVEAPDESFDSKTLQIAVGNGRYYGGGNAVHEEAALDDGHLHLYSLELASAWSMLPMLWSFRRGTHGRWARVRTSVGDRFEIRTRRARPVSADGEIVTSTPCSFRILPKALCVLGTQASG